MPEKLVNKHRNVKENNNNKKTEKQYKFGNYKEKVAR